MTPRLPRATLPVRRPGLARPGVVALLLLLLLPTAALAWDAGGYSSADESRLVSLTNQRRGSAGLSSLSVDSTLTSIARSRSKRMGDSHTFTHTVGGTTAFDDLRARGYCFLEAAENIAWNTYPDDQATTVAWQTLISSSTHLANILGRAFTRIGVGAYKAADGTHAYVMIFVHACGTTANPPATPTPTPVRRTAAPTRAPAPARAAASTPTSEPVPAPEEAQAAEVAAPDVAAPDVERPILASSRQALMLDEVLDLLQPLVRAMAGSGA